MRAGAFDSRPAVGVAGDGGLNDLDDIHAVGQLVAELSSCGGVRCAGLASCRALATMA